MNGLLTVREAAQILKVNTITLYHYLEVGKLKGHRIIGNRWRITQDDLEAFVKGSKKKK